MVKHTLELPNQLFQNFAKELLRMEEPPQPTLIKDGRKN